LIVTKSGDLALGECKRLGRRRNFNPVAKAVFQLSGDERAIRRSPHGWLEKRIDDDYSKFGFPKFVEALRLLGLRSERQQRKWWKVVNGKLNSPQRERALTAH
jgi:hypothetical protein